jgi:cytidylate kinase
MDVKVSNSRQPHCQKKSCRPAAFIGAKQSIVMEAEISAASSAGTPFKFYVDASLEERQKTELAEYQKKPVSGYGYIKQDISEETQ